MSSAVNFDDMQKLRADGMKFTSEAETQLKAVDKDKLMALYTLLQISPNVIEASFIKIATKKTLIEIEQFTTNLKKYYVLLLLLLLVRLLLFLKKKKNLDLRMSLIVLELWEQD